MNLEETLVATRRWRTGYGDGWDDCSMGNHLQPEELAKEDPDYRRGYIESMFDYGREVG